VLPQPKRGGLLRSTTPTPLLRCSSLFHSMRAHFTSRHIFILLWMGVYGFVCHQIGSSSSATRSCLIQTSHKLSSSPRQARITTGATRSELADESKLPYKCGLVFFYHVPSTGGVRCICRLCALRAVSSESICHWVTVLCTCSSLRHCTT
jgi:hypothetical protein